MRPHFFTGLEALVTHFEHLSVLALIFEHDPDVVLGCGCAWVFRAVDFDGDVQVLVLELERLLMLTHHVVHSSNIAVRLGHVWVVQAMDLNLDFQRLLECFECL